MQSAVAIIIINWNSLELTSNCISSLKGIEYANYSIIVVDNASADGSGKALKALFPEIVLIEAPENLGFAGGNNLGFRYAIASAHEYILMLNNDTFVEPDFLRHLIEYMNQHPEVGAIQPRIHFNHDRKILWNGGSYYSKCIGWSFSKGFAKTPSEETLRIKEVDWITGCAFLTRVDILKQTGLLVEKLFMYFEDVDLSFRIKSKGYLLVYHGGAVVYHIAGQSNKSKTKGKEGFVNSIVHYLNQRNRIWILKKYTPWYCIPTTLIFNTLYTGAIIAYFLIRNRFSKLKAVLSGVKDGLKGNIVYLRNNESY